MKNKWVRLLAREIVILMAIWLVVLLTNLIPTKKMISGEPEGQIDFPKLAEVEKINTNFRPEFNNLNRVDVLFKNPNLESQDSLEITLKNKNGAIIAAKDFSGFNLGDTSYARMDFSPVNEDNLTLEIKPKKIMDGKLGVGMAKGKIIFNQYFSAKVNLKEAINNTNQRLGGQKMVVGLPLFWGLWW